jgi:tetratricopeptide (TPR) repeat protein
MMRLSSFARLAAAAAPRLARPLPAVVLLCLLLAGCASFEQAGRDADKGFQSRIAKPVLYKLAGADPELRLNLERGRTELEAKDYKASVLSLNRAVWDFERIQKRSLRLAELSEAYELLSQAYLGLGNAGVAEEHLRLARALTDAGTRERSPSAAYVLGPAKEAYMSAQFPKAVKGLRQALVELEDLLDPDIRIIQLAETRCYLALSYFAAQEHDHVVDQIRRLWAHDPAMATCVRDAPRAVRVLIADVQKKKGL